MPDLSNALSCSYDRLTRMADNKVRGRGLGLFPSPFSLSITCPAPAILCRRTKPHEQRALTMQSVDRKRSSESPQATAATAIASPVAAKNADPTAALRWQRRKGRRCDLARRSQPLHLARPSLYPALSNPTRRTWARKRSTWTRWPRHAPACPHGKPS